jgi:hypothetical protein
VRQLIDAVVRVRRVVDELAALFEPRVDRVPRHDHEPWGIGLGLMGELADVVDRERVGERSLGSVHQQRALGVDDDPTVEHGLDAAGVRSTARGRS